MSESEAGVNSRNGLAAGVPAACSVRWRSVRNHIEWQKEGTRRPVYIPPEVTL